MRKKGGGLQRNVHMTFLLHKIKSVCEASLSFAKDNIFELAVITVENVMNEKKTFSDQVIY